jgi:hypothetical protein
MPLQPPTDTETARAIAYNRQANAWELVWLVAFLLGVGVCATAGRARR